MPLQHQEADSARRAGEDLGQERPRARWRYPHPRQAGAGRSAGHPGRARGQGGCEEAFGGERGVDDGGRRRGVGRHGADAWVHGAQGQNRGARLQPPGRLCRRHVKTCSHLRAQGLHFSARGRTWSHVGASSSLALDTPCHFLSTSQMDRPRFTQIPTQSHCDLSPICHRDVFACSRFRGESGREVGHRRANSARKRTLSRSLEPSLSLEVAGCHPCHDSM
mmetsp:Transcript_66535/g.138697  ORF Transcript_66535/g.138697 Transcript_66535/m.138697 type:complete len:221 (-) Transcript_66535:30-692(-)